MIQPIFPVNSLPPGKHLFLSRSSSLSPPCMKDLPYCSSITIPQESPSFAERSQGKPATRYPGHLGSSVALASHSHEYFSPQVCKRLWNGHMRRCTEQLQPFCYHKESSHCAEGVHRDQGEEPGAQVHGQAARLASPGHSSALRCELMFRTPFSVIFTVSAAENIPQTHSVTQLPRS